MTPVESATVAAWIASGFALLFGVAGFIVGLAGLRRAREANEVAAKANRIASDANSLSKESNGIAHEANEISRQNVDRADEQHDVAWEWKFGESPREHLIVIQNIGKSRALGVVAQFMFEGETEANDPPVDVEGRAVLALEIPGLADAFVRERAAEADADLLIEADLGMLGKIYVPSSPHVPGLFQCRLRVSWRTKSGAPRHYDSEWSMTQLTT